MSGIRKKIDWTFENFVSNGTFGFTLFGLLTGGGIVNTTLARVV